MVEQLATKTHGVEVSAKGFKIAGSEQFNGLQPGSPEAQAKFKSVWDEAHSAENIAKAQKLSGNQDANGMFNGKPLIKNHLGTADHPEGDSDLQMLKLTQVNGLSPQAAKMVMSKYAAKVKAGLSK